MADPLTTLDNALMAAVGLYRRPSFTHALLRDVPELRSSTHLRILRVLERARRTDPSPTIGDVAAQLGLDRSTVSRAVDAVATDGLVTKASCGGDQRRVRLSLTDHGREILRRATVTRRRVLREAVGGWDLADQSALASLLERLVADYDGDQELPGTKGGDHDRR